ncbi:hypothetical protein RHSIM_Rhsim12G0113800 [Rhododendron simsii]|uniref:ABC transporter domain-containing protein n=1 Tax=Rhododendron simsii TaxID=118357 RepID=A0A834L7A0_RHOSS|nr:hypothetical protein RHSIM_Rhsim12G0113800 [Rhododendron simsii]
MIRFGSRTDGLRVGSVGRWNIRPKRESEEAREKGDSLQHRSPATDRRRSLRSLLVDMEAGQGELEPKFLIHNLTTGQVISESGRLILKGINGEIPKLIGVGIIGPSDSGKSTLFRR